MKTVIFKGCGTALITPFTDDGINFEELRKLIEFQILEGADSLIICGTTGESSTMSYEEKKSVIDFSVKIVNKRVPVIAGTGGNNTQSVIEMSKYAEKAGVDALLIVTPYYNKTTQKGLISHYSKIAEMTFGMYLIHMVFENFFIKAFDAANKFPPLMIHIILSESIK